MKTLKHRKEKFRELNNTGKRKDILKPIINIYMLKIYIYESRMGYYFIGKIK